MSPDVIRIQVNKDSLINENISHHFINAKIKEKVYVITRLLKKRKKERGVIFCRTKAGTQALAKQLQEAGFTVGALEGDMKQKERDKVMRGFKKERFQYLVSTDVFARGIDVHDLSFVLHHQLPDQLEYYTHRSGRTARGGKKGESIVLILPSEMEKLVTVQKKLGIVFRQMTV